MPIASDDVKWLDPPTMNLSDRLFLPAILLGLQTTVKHLFRPAITQQFPEVRPEMPPNYRGVHRLNRDDHGHVKCVACYMCSTVCPARCIDIVAAPAPADWTGREKYPEVFVIDELRCIYCGMCEQACPCDAIELTSLFDLTGMSREEMMFDKEKLLSVFDQTVKDGSDPVRTHSGKLSIASDPNLGPLVAGTGPDTNQPSSVNPS